MPEPVPSRCPYCGEEVEVAVDEVGASEESYVEDCPVCCRPMEVYVQCQPGRIISISVTAD